MSKLAASTLGSNPFYGYEHNISIQACTACMMALQACHMLQKWPYNGLMLVHATDVSVSDCVQLLPMPQVMQRQHLLLAVTAVMSTDLLLRHLQHWFNMDEPALQLASAAVNLHFVFAFPSLWYCQLDMVEARLLLCLLRDVQRWWARPCSSCKLLAEDLKHAMKQSQSGIQAHHDRPQHIGNVNGYIYQMMNPIHPCCSTVVQSPAHVWHSFFKLAWNAYLHCHDELRLLHSMCDHRTAYSQKLVLVSHAAFCTVSTCLQTCLRMPTPFRFVRCTLSAQLCTQWQLLSLAAWLPSCSPALVLKLVVHTAICIL